MEARGVAIFGAGSAIAEQVARLLAAEGARLFLVARDGERLATIAADLKVRGAATVLTHTVDLDRHEAYPAMLEAMRAGIGEPDLALIAFGTLGDQTVMAGDPAEARRALVTNFVSPACLLIGLVAGMEARGAGTIAVVTSVAGDRGRAANCVYGAAKGGLQTFLSGLRQRLAGSGVRVLDIRPGLVATPMTAAIPKKGPLWATPERVAADIVAAVGARRSVLYTPWFWRWIMVLVRNLPEPLFHRTRF